MPEEPNIFISFLLLIGSDSCKPDASWGCWRGLWRVCKIMAGKIRGREKEREWGNIPGVYERRTDVRDQ